MKRIHLTIVLAFFCHTVHAQTPYAEFHAHLSTKHFYRETTSPYDLINPDLSIKDSATLAKFKITNWQSFGDQSRARRKAKESNYYNYDQANFSNLKNVPGSIICNSFYPFEKIMALTGFQRFVNSSSVSKLKLKRLREIASPQNSSFREFLAEYTFASIQDESYNGQQIRFAKDANELAKNIADGVTTYVMVIEGGQVLSDLYAGDGKKNGSKLARIKDWNVDQQTEHEIMLNVNTLKNLPHRLFFITTSHFSWNRISGFAKTLDKKGYRRNLISLFAKSEKQRKKLFLKWGEGIHGEIDCGDYIQTNDGYLLPLTNPPYQMGQTSPVRINNTCKLDLGLKVIAEFLNPATSIHSKPTYIDVKHMDIAARMQYYSLVDSLEKLHNINIPIIASHIAVSGENYSIASATGLNPNFDKYQEIKNPVRFYEDQKNKDAYWKSVTKYLTGTAFNPFDNNINYNTAGWFYPWSINLFDEEIPLIHKSDGIMGVMLDGRQLGEGMTNYTKKYRDSIKVVFNSIVATNPGLAYTDFIEYFEIEPFLRNVVYLAIHCDKNVCWDHISLGTDFDGLIHPMKICPTVEEIPTFQKKFKDYLSIFIDIHNNRGMFYGFPGKNILNGFSTSQIADKVFFTNGKRFIVKYF